ncbi:MAG: hypothetical protein N3D10_00610 [Candidatus Micrarchaeota archaeon]|nr:hypothetical protein [Candidatus Micrarchaeota archaeon]
MKAQASIEYIFALIIFLLILISITYLWNIKTEEIDNIKREYQSVIVAQKFLDTFRVLTNLGQNSSAIFTTRPDKIRYFKIIGQEIFFLDEQQSLEVYYIPAANLTSIEGELKIINVSYYGQNISIQPN